MNIYLQLNICIVENKKKLVVSCLLEVGRYSPVLLMLPTHVFFCIHILYMHIIHTEISLVFKNAL